jgi:hypothetical protein
MEDFIYIILAVVWLVISVLGNKKKKAQQQQQQQQPPQPYEQAPQPSRSPENQPQPEPSEFEVLLDDFFGQKTTTVERRQPEPVIEKDKHVFSDEYTFEGATSLEDDPFQHQMQEYDFNKYDGKGTVESDYEFAAEGHIETIDELIKSYGEQERIAEEKDSQLVVVDLDEQEETIKEWEFDARKAIIYSEIINRKYTENY